jgi:hypothetical protein
LTGVVTGIVHRRMIEGGEVPACRGERVYRCTEGTKVKKAPKASGCSSSTMTRWYEAPPVMKNYQEMGFRGRVQKPFRLEDLRETIWKVIQTEP